MALGFDMPPTNHPGISRATVAIVEREFEAVKTKRFIDRFVPQACSSVCQRGMVSVRIMVSKMVRAVRHGKEELSCALL